jgi:hypothetical protein
MDRTRCETGALKVMSLIDMTDDEIVALLPGDSDATTREKVAARMSAELLNLLSMNRRVW